MDISLTRRAVTLGLGLGAMTGLAHAADAGPWTGGGLLQRAGGQLHYVTLGADQGKPPLVLLHKLGGWVADWRLVAPALAQGRRVIAFDLPGHGDSQWLGPPPYVQSLGETASLLVGAFDEMGIAQVDVIGNSLGGCAAVPLAAFWPERVRRLGLVSCALGGAHTLAEIAVKIDKAKRTIGYSPAGDPLPLDAQHLVAIFGTVHPERITAEMNASRQRAGRWVQPSERGVAITDLRGTLKRVEAPTLLLYGSNNKDYLPFRAGAEAALKHSVAAFVQDAGAFVMQDNPPATAAILNRFLNQD
jgi:pimeloyl-ACP methyl ester carboxylesterase